MSKTPKNRKEAVAEEQTVQNEAVENGAVETQAPQNQLTIDDIRNLLKIVEAASERGAFKAAELQTVGTVYNKVKAFVDSVTPKTDEPAAEAE